MLTDYTFIVIIFSLKSALNYKCLQTEEEKVHLERKTREAEQLTARLVDESERRAAEANRLKDELLRARLAEKQAKEKLLEFLSRNAYINTVSIISIKPLTELRLAKNYKQ